MKKLLTILFLLPLVCFGQITATSISNGFQTLGVGAIVSPTLTAGKFYVLYAGTTNSGGTAATVSLSGTGQTWTEITSITSASGDKRLQVFRYAATSTTTSNITFSYTGTQDGGWAVLYEVTGCLMTGTNGANAIVQSPTATGSPTADPSITMSSLANGSAVIVGFINNANPFGGTAEAGWTESIDNGYATPATGGYTMHRVSTTDNTPTVTAASSDWAGIAVELRSGSRRIFNIQ